MLYKVDFDPFLCVIKEMAQTKLDAKKPHPRCKEFRDEFVFISPHNVTR